MVSSAAECEGGLVHDGSFVATIEIQLLYNLARGALLRSTPLSSHAISSLFITQGPVRTTTYNNLLALMRVKLG